MPTASSILDRVTGRSLEQVLQEGVAGTLLAISASLISGILTVADLFTRPLESLGTVLVTVIQTFFITPLDIISQGAITSATSLEPGATFDLGPLTLLLGLVTVLAFFWILAQYLQEDETSNVAPGLPFDVSLPFFREEEGDERG